MTLDTAQTRLDLRQMGKTARAASRALARAATAQKDAAILAVADALEAHADTILAANALDMDDARAAGLSAAMLDRLSLAKRLPGIAADTRSVAALPDPVGEVFDAAVLPNGLHVEKRRTPLGVLGVIYEARPNVTVDVSVLAIKSGNAAILRGGSETLRSNVALVGVIRDALAASGFPPDVVQLITDRDRRYVGELLRLHEYVDLIIPRGGQSLHQFCRENSAIPVITGGIGICHLYVDESADLSPALDVIFNAKTQRPTVCNALDTVLVHPRVAGDFIPRLIDHLGRAGVAFRLDPLAWDVLRGRDVAGADVQPAGPDDFDTEWLSLVLGVRVVSGLDEALEHIAAHSTGHSDGILTRDEANAARFVDEVDSAAVYVNASTRFTDGGALGLGAEIAISTQKLHARGPMALRELTTYKWVVRGENHVRA
ncbi:MAG: glutamate-5-semialdehyde dehydrogenase [Anaerolineae bacterium]|nr:glutamate-5-semialdehyde dehydrogenase [Anaerolineae bacterium]